MPMHSILVPDSPWAMLLTLGRADRYYFHMMTYRTIKVSPTKIDKRPFHGLLVSISELSNCRRRCGSTAHVINLITVCRFYFRCDINSVETFSNRFSLSD